MHESHQQANEQPLPITQARVIDFRKVYALLYRAYVRSQKLQIRQFELQEGELDHE